MSGEMSSNKNKEFLTSLSIEHPVICGPMYPCSNPELVAAVSEAGGIGIVQPISLTFVHKYDFRDGIRHIRTLTNKPIGFNALIEKSSKYYQDKMNNWIDIALEEGVRFFITSLGNPDWVVKKVSKFAGVVYHDVTEDKWAKKGVDAGVHGLIAVNNRAGGHAGGKSMQELYDELKKYNLPLVCAGGIGNREQFQKAIDIGYSACQLGTRFIATTQCSASEAYKNAIVNSKAEDVVLSEKITGVPVSVINTDYIKQMGTKANFITRYFLRNKRTKHWLRTYYTLLSVLRLKKSFKNEKGEFWQAGKSVSGIDKIDSVSQVIKDLCL